MVDHLFSFCSVRNCTKSNQRISNESGAKYYVFFSLKFCYVKSLGFDEILFFNQSTKESESQLLINKTIIQKYSIENVVLVIFTFILYCMMHTHENTNKTTENNKHKQ